MTPADVPVRNAAGETIAAQEAEQPYVVRNESFEADGALTLEKAGGIALGTPNADGGVAEIVAYDEEKREGIAAADGTEVPNKVRVLDNAVKAGISADGNYLYGARSFSLFEVTDSGLTLAFDSASDFEAKTFAYLPDYYNASNDDADLESRTAKKGVEPEAVAVAELGGKAYAFIALERIGGIMVYDITDPAAAKYVNYVNTRDFNAPVAGDVAPEGLAFAQTEEGVYLLAAFEVSGTVASYRLSFEAEEADPGTDPEPTPVPEPTPDPEPDTGTDEPAEGGCGSLVGTAGGACAVLLLAGAAVALAKKRR